MFFFEHQGNIWPRVSIMVFPTSFCVFGSMFLDTNGEYRIFGLSTVPPEELTLISKLSTVIQKDTIPLPLLVEETIGILIYKVGNDGK